MEINAELAKISNRMVKAGLKVSQGNKKQTVAESMNNLPQPKRPMSFDAFLDVTGYEEAEEKPEEQKNEIGNIENDSETLEKIQESFFSFLERMK